MDLVELRAHMRQLMDDHGLQSWSLGYDRAVRRAGQARWRTSGNAITLSAPIMREYSFEQAHQVCLHEIAHALAGPRQGHNAHWKAIARQLGYTGGRCTDQEAPKIEGAWIGTCRAGHVFNRVRSPRMVVSCTKCCKTPSTRHLISWTYQGSEVPMSASYLLSLRRLRQEHPYDLADISANGALLSAKQEIAVPAQRQVPQIESVPVVNGRAGQQVRLVCPRQPKWHGRVVVIKKVARTRYHVEVDGKIVTVPMGMVAAA